MKYRKVPVVIDAWQWVGVPDGGAEEPPQWVENALLGWPRPASLAHFPHGDAEALQPWRELPHIAINTGAGIARAEQNDWIIRGVSGELYPCKPDVFALTYELVKEH